MILGDKENVLEMLQTTSLLQQWAHAQFVRWLRGARSLAESWALFASQAVLVKTSLHGWRSGRGHHSLTQWSIQGHCFQLLCLLLFPSLTGFRLSLNLGAMGAAAKPLLPFLLVFYSQLADCSLHHGNSNVREAEKMEIARKSWSLWGVSHFRGSISYVYSYEMQ